MSNTCVYDKPPCDHAALRRILGPGRFRRGSMRTRRPITPAYQCPPGGTKPSQAVGRRTGYRPNVFAEPAHGVTDSLGDRAPALSTPWLTERTRPVTNWSATSGSWNDLSPTNSSSVSGYVVEFGGKTNSNSSLGTGFAGAVTTTSTVAVAATPVVPSAPSITAVSDNASADLSWTPASDGGATITSYQGRSTADPGRQPRRRPRRLLLTRTW